MKYVASDIFKNSGIKFGTSGARGLVEDFTPEVCVAFTIAFLTTMRAEFKFSKVSIGIDRRPSSPEIAAACCAAAAALEIEVEYFGVLPTPALALQSMQAKQPAIMVTGSHIPFDRNGIKFYRPDGEISKQDEALIVNSNSELPDNTFPYLPKETKTAQTLYIERYLNIVKTGLLCGKRVGIYQHSSAGRDLYKELFESLGAEVIILGRCDKFVPIDTEAVSGHDIAQGKEWTKKYQLDFLFSTDGDGDRPLTSDENGQWLRGDIVGLLTAKYLKIDVLAVPVSCNTAVEKSELFSEVIRTKIGSPYVIEGMQTLSKSYQKVAGFEANGGFLLNSDLVINKNNLAALPTRDAILPILAIMAMTIERNKNLSDIVLALPQRFTTSDRIKEFSTEQSIKLLTKWSMDHSLAKEVLNFENDIIEQDNTDGLRWTLDDNSIIHLRPSGNAPEMRCYVESNTESKAVMLLNKTIECVRVLA